MKDHPNPSSKRTWAARGAAARSDKTRTVKARLRIFIVASFSAGKISTPESAESTAGRGGLPEKDLGDRVEPLVDRLGLGQRLGQGDGDDVFAVEPNHQAEPLLVDEVDRGDPETGGQNAVEGRGRAAALDVAEDRHAGLDPRAFF